MNLYSKLLVSFLITIFGINAYGWGQKGHDVVAYIAQQHLTPLTAAKLDSILDGYSLTYWSNWLDNASHTPEYSYSKTWHYKNIDEDQTFENAPLIPEGNIVDALYDQINVIRQQDVSKEDKALAVKMIIHFLGDIHQPMHMGHASDRGGNFYNVNFFNRPSNLHSVWDSDLLEAAHKWSHTEWQEEIDRLSPEKQMALLMGGNPSVWGKETYELCDEIYKSTPREFNIEYDYVARWAPIIEMQLAKGGLRLADVLNSIFDPYYHPKNSIVNKQE